MDLCTKVCHCDDKISMSYGLLTTHACPLDCIKLSFGQQLSMSQDCYNKECMSIGPLHSNQNQSPGRQQLLGHFCGLTNNSPRGTVTHVCHGAICATLDAAFCVHHSTQRCTSCSACCTHLSVSHVTRGIATMTLQLF